MGTFLSSQPLTSIQHGSPLSKPGTRNQELKSFVEIV